VLVLVFEARMLAKGRRWGGGSAREIARAWVDPGSLDARAVQNVFTQSIERPADFPFFPRHAKPIAVPLPPPILSALKSNTASSSSLSSSLHKDPNSQRKTNRDSIQRKQCWWLPYVVLEFDKNEVLIEALGGEWDGPVWRYSATLYVSPPLSSRVPSV
jgi:hypothetical protein